MEVSLLSISLYSGTPGSFKSYHAVKSSISWLKSGGNLITNFPLNYSKVIKKPIKGVYERIDNMQLTVDYLIQFAIDHHKPSVKAQTLVVIDEASIKFNSRDFNVKDRMGWINFFANHRHFNFDVILITQQDRMLDRQIRGLIETEFKHRALKHYKLFGWLLDIVFHGCFMCVEVWYPCKLKTDAWFHVFNKKIASCYDTMGLFVDSKNKMAEAFLMTFISLLLCLAIMLPIASKPCRAELTLASGVAYVIAVSCLYVGVTIFTDPEWRQDYCDFFWQCTDEVQGFFERVGNSIHDNYPVLVQWERDEWSKIANAIADYFTPERFGNSSGITSIRSLS